MSSHFLDLELTMIRIHRWRLSPVVSAVGVCRQKSKQASSTNNQPSRSTILPLSYQTTPPSLPRRNKVHTSSALHRGFNPIAMSADGVCFVYHITQLFQHPRSAELDDPTLDLTCPSPNPPSTNSHPPNPRVSQQVPNHHPR